MVFVKFCKSGAMRILALGLMTVFGAATISTSEADARPAQSGKSVQSSKKVTKSRSRNVKARAATAKYSPPYAAIVIDANSGKVLHENSADGRRHPASLTKIMTLYMLFEQLDAGKLRLDSELPVSAHAAAQAPSKLGLKPGSTLRVEDAIRALITKSANDVASVVAERLGGDEPQFARMMTRKALALGMNSTVYRNASGLPNAEQVTTARDQALLGRAIQDRFPKYYRYFSTPSFTFRGHAMRNHNRLLGQVEGIDGIKTGYITASGFNLVSSVRRGNRHLVAVVMGGRTAGLRDARMRELIAEHIVVASTRRTAPVIAEAPEGAVPAVLPRPRVAEATPAPPAAQEREETIAAAAASTDPDDVLKPIAVKTVRVRASQLQTAAIGSIAVAPATPPAPVAAAAAAPAPVATRPPVPPAPIRTAAIGNAAAPAAGPQPAPPAIVATETVRPAPSPPTPRAEPAPSASRSGWLIQVGALDSVEAANDRLAAARSKAMNILGRADAFTEPVTKGDKTLHRARFAGFVDRSRAEAACRALKRADIVCLAIRN